jgi:hypothetical protein
MQRRTYQPQVSGERSGGTVALRFASGRSVPSPASKLPNTSSSKSIRVWVLIVIASMLNMLIYIFPENRKAAYETEQRLEQVAYDTEQRLEHDVIDWWSKQQQKPPLDSSNNDHNYDEQTIQQLRNDANERMINQGSKWVDSEKKLKAALKVLVARQAEGKDLGVPVLTRWLGDDIPVFAGEGVDVDEWNRKIQQKYEEMRVEEDRWREMITATLMTNRG